MAIKKPDARQSLQSDINGNGTQKRQGYGYEKARRDQSEGGHCALSKSCSAITGCYQFSTICNPVSGVMVRAHASNVVDHEFESDRVKPKTIKLILLLLHYTHNNKEKDQKLVYSESG